MAKNPQMGWNRFEEDLSEVFSVTTGITLNAEYRIETYFYKTKMGSRTYVFGMPRHSGVPILEDNTSSFQSILPEGAVDLMSVIEGDLSPWSYVEAAILYRELSNTCNGWHNIIWGVEEILEQAPDTESALKPNEELEPSDWLDLNRANDWRAIIQMNGMEVSFQFYTFNGFYQETLFKNVDTFGKPNNIDLFGSRAGNYSFESERLPIAFGGNGTCW